VQLNLFSAANVFASLSRSLIKNELIFLFKNFNIIIMENMNFTNWIRYSATFRVAVVGVLALLLLIPVGMVKNLIYEREYTKKEAVSEISQKWGERQTIAGLILSVPYKKYIINEKNERVSVIQYAHFLPENLTINAELKPQIRSRGIFDAVVYSTEINFSGKFAKINLKDLGIKESETDWSKAFVSVGISDTRGIQENIKLNWNNTSLEFKPGIQTNDVVRFKGNNYDEKPYAGGRVKFMQRSVSPPDMTNRIGHSSGISAQLPTSIKNKNVDNYKFSFHLKLNGSQDLQFVPLGRTTEISLKSDWRAPSFSGAFLPDAREVAKTGFNASWKILDLNRGYPQSWLGNKYNIYSSASGVKLLAGIDDYAKTARAAKYALLIIALTFLVFFFGEVFNGKKIHPIQYILVGLSLVLFTRFLFGFLKLPDLVWRI